MECCKKGLSAIALVGSDTKAISRGIWEEKAGRTIDPPSCARPSTRCKSSVLLPFQLFQLQRPLRRLIPL